MADKTGYKLVIFRESVCSPARRPGSAVKADSLVNPRLNPQKRLLITKCKSFEYMCAQSGISAFKAAHREVFCVWRLGSPLEGADVANLT
jgi:hypothetical protein